MRCLTFKFQSALLLLSFFCCVEIRAADPPGQPGMLDRLMHPDRKQKSAYQGKMFNTGSGYSSKTFKTDEYAGTKQFASGSYETRPYGQAKQSWLGKMIFHEKKLPENLQGANRDATKQFVSKTLPEKNYADLEKKSSYGSKDAFETRNISLKGKSQGAIDNDPKLQEAVKKGLSIDDVRKLLNKAP